MKIRNSLLIATLSIGLYSNSSYSIDLYKDTKPQSTGKTCQSYAAALALASVGDPEFHIKTFDELREVEKIFRQFAETYGNPLDHSNWDKAMSDLTNGKYTFERTYKHSNIIDWLWEVKNHTTIDSDIDVLLNKLSGGNISVVLTSVYELEGSKYKTGHIITIIGVIGNGMNSSTRIVTFNSAIKGGNMDGIMCRENDAPGDYKYRAGVIDTNNYRLKGFDSYLVMRIVKQ